MANGDTLLAISFWLFRNMVESLTSTYLFLCLQYLGVILSGIVFTWIKSANSLAGMFNKAMEANEEDEGETATA